MRNSILVLGLLIAASGFAGSGTNFVETSTTNTYLLPCVIPEDVSGIATGRTETAGTLVYELNVVRQCMRTNVWETCPRRRNYLAVHKLCTNDAVVVVSDDIGEIARLDNNSRALVVDKIMWVSGAVKARSEGAESGVVLFSIQR